MFQEVSTTQFEAKQNISENLKYLKVHTTICQEDILTLKSQLDIKQNKSEDVKEFTNLQEEYAKLKLQLQNQVKYSEELDQLEKKNSKLATQLGEVLHNVEGLKVRTNILQGENSKLKVQLELTEKRKERCDIAIQTDMVCMYVACYILII